MEKENIKMDKHEFMHKILHKIKETIEQFSANKSCSVHLRLIWISVCFKKKKKYQKINAFLIFCLVSVPNIFSFSPTQIVIWLLLQLLLLQKEIIFKSFASLKMLSFLVRGYSPLTKWGENTDKIMLLENHIC